MIVIQLNGGLGNQLFQYSLGRRLSLLYGVPLSLDIASYNRDKLRSYQLGWFNGLRVTTCNPNRLLKRISPLLEFNKPYFKKSVYREPFFQYDEHILDGKDDGYYIGNWQSEKYFITIDTIIQTDLDPIGKIVDEEPTVAVHIRRTDYVTDPKTNAVHGILNEDYYRRAMDYIIEQVDKPKFRIFSDDPKQSTGNDWYTDFKLMSQCQHHIIANSSFSWWAAWLCRNPTKIVIAPKNWFADKRINTSDLIPNPWVRL